LDPPGLGVGGDTESALVDDDVMMKPAEGNEIVGIGGATL
jgi:hypothetical protein